MNLFSNCLSMYAFAGRPIFSDFHVSSPYNPGAHRASLPGAWHGGIHSIPTCSALTSGKQVRISRYGTMAQNLIFRSDSARKTSGHQGNLHNGGREVAFSLSA